MRDQVDEIKQKTDIVQIIGQEVKLKKAGRNYKGLCPFHSEKSPSFMVSSELQIYKCFGCGESGDVFTFLQKQEGMEFYEALSFLADKVGIKLLPREGEDRSETQTLIEINEIAAQLYHYLLQKHTQGAVGKKYIIDTRKLEEKTIETFKIGFAPDSPQILFDYLTKKRKFTSDQIEKAGLVYKIQRGFMDRFRQRVIFPIEDHQGRTIALGGRILPQYDTGRVGKYINSPETPIFHKSRTLYGLSVTKDAIRAARTAIVVEGEMDTVSSWQAGVKNVVAIKGTALTEDHIRMLGRFADTLVFALDSDFAGDNAAVKGLLKAQDAGMELKVVDMGKYKDPDEFARADPEGYKKAIGNAVDAMNFIVNVVIEKHDISKGTGKARASKELVPILAQIPDTIVQAHYVSFAAQKLGVPVEAVIEEVQKAGRIQMPTVSDSEAPVSVPKKKNKSEVLEEQVVIFGVDSALKDLISPETLDLVESRKLLKIVEELKQFLDTQKQFHLKDFSISLPDELKEYFNTIVLQYSEEENVDKQYQSAKTELIKIRTNQQRGKLLGKIRLYEEKNDEIGLKQAQQELDRLNEEQSGHAKQ